MDYRIKASIGFFLAGAFALWLAAAFVSLMPNPLDWPEMGRFLFVVFLVFIAWASAFPLITWDARTATPDHTAERGEL